MEPLVTAALVPLLEVELPLPAFAFEPFTELAAPLPVACVAASAARRDANAARCAAERDPSADAAAFN